MKEGGPEREKGTDDHNWKEKMHQWPGNNSR